MQMIIPNNYAYDYWLQVSFLSCTFSFCLFFSLWKERGKEEERRRKRGKRVFLMSNGLLSCSISWRSRIDHTWWFDTILFGEVHGSPCTLSLTSVVMRTDLFQTNFVSIPYTFYIHFISRQLSVKKAFITRCV